MTDRGPIDQCWNGMCFEFSLGDIPIVGIEAAGDGAFGHADMGTSVSEWVLDLYANDWYSMEGATCSNCANLTRSSGLAGMSRVHRGGYGSGPETYGKGANDAYLRTAEFGIRCARD
jgi:formylglycine-generating enzyme required for sulfatase activity